MLINSRSARSTRAIDALAATADLDAYMTDPRMVEALIHIEGGRLPPVCWEPGVGTGNIANAIIASGRRCFGSDVYDYGWPSTKIEDYADALPEWDVEAVVTNPPFHSAQQWIEKSIREVPYAAYLLRSNFLELQKRLPLFRDKPPARVWISSRRAPMMHRFGWVGKQASSNMTFAWFVWDARSDLKLQLGFFDWKTLEHAP